MTQRPSALPITDAPHAPRPFHALLLRTLPTDLPMALPHSRCSNGTQPFVFDQLPPPNLRQTLRPPQFVRWSRVGGHPTARTRHYDQHPIHSCDAAPWEPPSGTPGWPPLRNHPLVGRQRSGDQPELTHGGQALADRGLRHVLALCRRAPGGLPSAVFSTRTGRGVTTRSSTNTGSRTRTEQPIA